MRFEQTPLAGAWKIELELLGDGRGWFARAFDAQEFRARGLDPCVVQCNLSFNARRDTIRGMHYQAEPHGEPKLVRCIRGAIFDVAIDLRPDSHTYLQWHGLELSAENRRALYLPPGMAHGFQTLVDECEVLYQMGRPHTPEATRGLRWNDPAFAIAWPATRGERTLSDKDRAYPDFQLETTLRAGR